MTSPVGYELVTALREFVERIEAVAPVPDGPAVASVSVSIDGGEASLSLSGSVAVSLIMALREYHDPRDNGRCEHCGGRRLDSNLMCADCQRPNGVFGQLIMERAARHAAPDPDTDLVKDLTAAPERPAG
ncbi:hypothetical protein [Rugosimonospora africana]|uniref:Uncharacterized protein n=1 Tax=Rugosimonospora africana TaxID=556532 RepID=A0A8J3QV41_9ACTN|nr:hypothetical protein [Rugosimonospora africana]GIH17041.1 hypothetical protein Raf01_52130 [Rugosimonospora africana]